MMPRETAVALLIVTTAVPLLLAWFQLRSERIAKGRWVCWPLTLGWRLAGALVAVSLFSGELLLLAWRGRDDIHWLLVAPIAHLALWLIVLWLGFSRGDGRNGSADGEH